MHAKRHRHVLLGYLGPQKGRVLLLCALLAGSIGLPLAGPELLRSFIDTATGGGATGTLSLLAVLYIATALAGQAVAVAAAYLSEQVGWIATNLLRGDLAAHCLRLDLAFHNAHTPGELIERIDGDITALALFFSRFVTGVIGAGLLTLSMIVLMCREDLRVGGAFAAFTLVALLVLERCRSLAVPRLAEERQASAELFGFVEERLSGADDIRANGAGNYVMQRYHRVAGNHFRRKRTAWTANASVPIAGQALFAVAYLLVLALGAALYQRREVTLGTVYLFFQYTRMLRPPLLQITEQMKEFQKATAAIGRVRELLAFEPAIRDGRDVALPGGALCLEFEHVTFAYGDDAGAPALTDLSFRLEPGQVLGLLGRSGSGKSTLARLLFRLYEPGCGAIRLGGVDLRETRLADLRRRVAVVTQDVQLFQATVRDNLSFFDRSIGDKQLLDAIAALGLEEWLRQLPAGLDTELHSHGGGLSAGEAQLLAFARVFLTDPGLVILDEASSRLDPLTERLIERAVDRLLAGRTGIVIAHRLATVRRADRIVILDGGRIDEHGDRAALAADRHSRFARLLRTSMQEVLA